MAIQATIPAAENDRDVVDVVAGYWWVVQVNTSVVDQSIFLQAYGYAGRAAKDAGKGPFTSRAVSIGPSPGQKEVAPGVVKDIPSFGQLFVDPAWATKLQATIHVPAASVVDNGDGTFAVTLTPARIYDALKQSSYKILKEVYPELAAGTEV